jgi:hypothetical protein
MRAAARLALLVLVVPIASCWVHRKSDDLRCNVSGDCRDGGTCEDGYCIGGASNGCPSPCTDCNTDDKTCKIDCTSGGSCGSVQCPAGYDCTIRCGAGACQDIDCAAAAACDIDCQGGAACHNIHCGPGPCSISCSAQACASVDCVTSCACDVSCPNPNTCPAMSCPMVFGTGAPCTRTGGVGGRCDSNPDGCDTCPVF